MGACNRKWQRYDHFLVAARAFHFRLAATDLRNKSSLAQYDFEGAALVAAEQECRQRVLQIALGLFAGVTLRMDIEQVARGNEPFPLFLYLRGELEFH